MVTIIAVSEKGRKTMIDLIKREDAICAVCDNCLRTDLEVLDGCLGKDCSTKTVLESLPSAEPKIDDENELKFYYVESIDDYWIGQRVGNFYYADWNDGLGFVWSHSRYLPWGEHIVNENTLWKEHTYPSEPIEVPFTEWIVGFAQKYFAEPKSVEVVRCENCKYFEPDLMPIPYFEGDGVCCHEHWKLEDVGFEVKETDFCSYGERKNDEKISKS